MSARKLKQLEADWRRERRISEIGLQTYRDKLREHVPRTVFDDMLPPEPTINRVPKPEPIK